MHTYHIILELNTANRKVADLMTKIQRTEEENMEQNHGELLFIIMLYSIPLLSHTYIVNVSILRHTDLMVLALEIAKMEVTDLKRKIQRMEEVHTELNHGELLFTIVLYALPMQLCI